MYVPDAYRAPDPRAIVRLYPFSSVSSVGRDGRPHVTQTPVIFETDEADETRLIGHFSRANPHAGAIYAGAPAIALFTGPHAYISPAWYVDKPTVPTWDYVSAQVSGSLTPIDDPEEQITILHRIIALSETASGTRWSMEMAPPGKIEQLLPHIRSFRIVIDEIEGATKLNQTHPWSDRIRVADALEQRGQGDDATVAALIRTAGDA